MSNFSRLVSNANHREKAFNLMKLEVVVIQLVSEPNRLPVRTLKSRFRSTPIVSAFTGNDLVANIASKLQTEKKEAFHIATQLFKYTYLYPVDQSVTSLKDDSTLYRMQSEDRWPSQFANPTNVDYSTYLEKKLLLKQKLAEHEQDAYDRFSVTYARNWQAFRKKAQEEIAEEEFSKEDRVVFQGEERTFWRLHRPPPGEPLVMESSIQKRNANRSELTDFEIIQDLEIRIEVYKKALKRSRIKGSQSADLIISHMETNSKQDPFLKKNLFNPWSNENKTVPGGNTDRFLLWSLSFDSLIKDKMGHDLFMAFLKSEVSTENLGFCEEVVKYKLLPSSKLNEAAQQIYKQYIGPTARNEINIDGKTLRIIRDGVTTPDRYTFDPAQNYIYDLMRKDSYSRFLKSPFFTAANKKCSMERKAGPVSQVAFPFNAHSIHILNGGCIPEVEPPRITRSNSMDTLSEASSMVSPSRNNVTESQSVIENKSRKGSLFRNSSGFRFSDAEFPDFGNMEDRDKTKRQFAKSKSVNQPHNIVPLSITTVSASFDETSLTNPTAPAIKNFPKPKSKSYSQDKAPSIVLPL